MFEMTDRKLADIALDLVKYIDSLELVVDNTNDMVHGSNNRAEYIGRALGMRYALSKIEDVITEKDTIAYYNQKKKELRNPSGYLAYSADRWNEKILR